MVKNNCLTCDTTKNYKTKNYFIMEALQVHENNLFQYENIDCINNGLWTAVLKP